MYPVLPEVLEVVVGEEERILSPAALAEEAEEAEGAEVEGAAEKMPSRLTWIGWMPVF